MNRIAITGGRGRLAAGVAAHLRGTGHEVVLFSRIGDEGFRDIASLVCPEALGAYDAVLHLGWSTVPVVSEENPGIEEREDFPFIRAMVKASRECVRPPLLLFFSTAAVYGNTGAVANIASLKERGHLARNTEQMRAGRPRSCFDAKLEGAGGASAREETPCRPIGHYAAAKLAAEKLFEPAQRSCILRISNVFGPGRAKTRPQGIIPLLLESARSNRPMTIWGDGSAVKDYIAASDLHRAVQAVIAEDLCGVFNVSSGCSLSVNDLISLVEETCGHLIQRNYLPRYPWDVTVSHVSSEKLRRLTGWRAEVSPQDFMRELVRRGD